MLALLSFPFRFAAQHPLATLGYLALLWVADVAFQFVMAAAGIDPLRGVQLTSLDDVTGYAVRLLTVALGHGIVLSAATAPLFVAALRHLKLRERGVDVWDVLLLVVVSLLPETLKSVGFAFGRFVYGFVELLVQRASADEWSAAYLEPTDLVVSLIIVIVATYLYARVWVVEPAALRVRKLGLMEAWRSTRKQVWRSLMYAAAVTMILNGAWWLYGSVVLQLPEPPNVETLQDAFQPLALMSIGLDALAGSIQGIFYGCAVAFALASLSAAKR